MTYIYSNDTNDKKKAFRAWKSGKTWLYATTILGVTIVTGAATTVVKADESIINTISTATSAMPSASSVGTSSSDITPISNSGVIEQSIATSSSALFTSATEVPLSSALIANSAVVDSSSTMSDGITMTEVVHGTLSGAHYMDTIAGPISSSMMSEIFGSSSNQDFGSEVTTSVVTSSSTSSVPSSVSTVPSSSSESSTSATQTSSIIASTPDYTIVHHVNGDIAYDDFIVNSNVSSPVDSSSVPSSASVTSDVSSESASSSPALPSSSGSSSSSASFWSAGGGLYFHIVTHGESGGPQYDALVIASPASTLSSYATQAYSLRPIEMSFDTVLFDSLTSYASYLPGNADIISAVASVQSAASLFSSAFVVLKNTPDTIYSMMDGVQSNTYSAADALSNAASLVSVASSNAAIISSNGDLLASAYTYVSSLAAPAVNASVVADQLSVVAEYLPYEVAISNAMLSAYPSDITLSSAYSAVSSLAVAASNQAVVVGSVYKLIYNSVAGIENNGSIEVSSTTSDSSSSSSMNAAILSQASDFLSTYSTILSNAENSVYSGLNAATMAASGQLIHYIDENGSEVGTSPAAAGIDVPEGYSPANFDFTGASTENTLTLDAAGELIDNVLSNSVYQQQYQALLAMHSIVYQFVDASNGNTVVGTTTLPDWSVTNFNNDQASIGVPRLTAPAGYIFTADSKPATTGSVTTDGSKIAIVQVVPTTTDLSGVNVDPIISESVSKTDEMLYRYIDSTNGSFIVEEDIVPSPVQYLGVQYPIFGPDPILGPNLIFGPSLSPAMAPAGYTLVSPVLPTSQVAANGQEIANIYVTPQNVNTETPGNDTTVPPVADVTLSYVDNGKVIGTIPYSGLENAEEMIPAGYNLSRDYWQANDIVNVGFGVDDSGNYVLKVMSDAELNALKIAHTINYQYVDVTTGAIVGTYSQLDTTFSQNYVPASAPLDYVFTGASSSKINSDGSTTITYDVTPVGNSTASLNNVSGTLPTPTAPTSNNGNGTVPITTDNSVPIIIDNPSISTAPSSSSELPSLESSLSDSLSPTIYWAYQSSFVSDNVTSTSISSFGVETAWTGSGNSSSSSVSSSEASGFPTITSSEASSLGLSEAWAWSDARNSPSSSSSVPSFEASGFIISSSEASSLGLSEAWAWSDARNSPSSSSSSVPSSVVSTITSLETSASNTHTIGSSETKGSAESSGYQSSDTPTVYSVPTDNSGDAPVTVSNVSEISGMSAGSTGLGSASNGYQSSSVNSPMTDLTQDSVVTQSQNNQNVVSQSSSVMSLSVLSQNSKSVSSAVTNSTVLPDTGEGEDTLTFMLMGSSLLAGMLTASFARKKHWNAK